MGHHYVPQAHLRRFEIPDDRGCICMYDKQIRTWRRVAIKVAAQEADFYDGEVEKDLANNVEAPGNDAIAKLRRRERLTDEERFELSKYMSFMLTRGPRFRAKRFEELPVVMNRTVAQVESEFDQLEVAVGDPIRRQLMSAFVDAGQKIVDDPTPLTPVLRTPFNSDQMNAGVYLMTWHVFQTKGPDYFITGDTPAHFFECWGLGTAQSEFVFPVATDLAIVGENGGRRATTMYQSPRPIMVREINKRIAHHCFRFAFHQKQESWIPTIVNDPQPHLSRIVWKR